ncbi:metal-sensing transcriptional repressor [Massilia arenosa]|uniref:Metal-sensing transcriptional repressor n=1 Tax=Zemynaea arenosa TaxID=2561931 RepID=A0A4Y9SFZ0_9BURK|nr:metal-sensing transcriptional repressor [Massilia arenosa]TFW22597.1 metal-sensing transcriptional repressor [Massilia arenosa]
MADAPLTDAQKKDLMNRLARIEGQLRGVQKLISIAQEPSDCDAAAQQMAAASKALNRCFIQLLSAELRTESTSSSTLEQAQASAEHLAKMLDKYL